MMKSSKFKVQSSKLTEAEVIHVAKLARLTLTSPEVKKFQRQLNEIFEYINQIGEMRTENIKETSQTTGSENVFREDKIDSSRIIAQEKVLSNAPSKYKGFFQIKAILDK